MRKLFFYLKRRSYVWLLCLLCCVSLTAKAQYFDLEKGRKRVTLPFQFVRNLLVIQLNINEKGPYNFILDTGVGMMLITDPKIIDSVDIANKRVIKIAGLGEGDAYEAYLTPPLKIDIPKLESSGVSAAILKNDPFGLSNYAGIPIHGLLGYEFFNKLSVKISFSDSTITVAQPKNMKMLRKQIKLPLSIEDNKPYITTKVTYGNGTARESKLVLDLGAGHPLSMENVTDREQLQSTFIPANLGMGLTGVISGYISRIKGIEIGNYFIKDVVTSFPDNNGRVPAVPRDGNLGVGVLKKFNIIFDYTNHVIYLKPGYFFRTPFEHDMTGLSYYATGRELDRVIIDNVVPGTAGDDAGLQKDDEILAINFKPIRKMTLEQIDNLFKSENGRSFIVDIFREKKLYKVVLTLKRRI